MKPPTDWNPNLYLTFGGERTQAAVDLIARVKRERPARILDIGCGPGNSTRALAARWPESRTAGLDSSAAMIGRARADRPEGEWILADAARYETAEKYDLVFSCAAIQWIPDHRRLLDRFLALLSPGGALAVQLPLFPAMPMSRAVERAANRPRWKGALAGAGESFTYHDRDFYYDLLAPRSRAVELWETTYIHVMPSLPALVEWIRATGLRPYLDRLPDEREKRDFEFDLLAELASDYPPRPDGRVLFPFPRLFFIAYT